MQLVSSLPAWHGRRVGVGCGAVTAPVLSMNTCVVKNEGLTPVPGSSGKKALSPFGRVRNVASKSSSVGDVKRGLLSVMIAQSVICTLPCTSIVSAAFGGFLAKPLTVQLSTHVFNGVDVASRNGRSANATTVFHTCFILKT